jgi:hypothetical protein
MDCAKYVKNYFHYALKSILRSYRLIFTADRITMTQATSINLKFSVYYEKFQMSDPIGSDIWNTLYVYACPHLAIHPDSREDCVARVQRI